MSLQKTKIDWTDCVCNPVVGCPRGCEYCYARKLNTRFEWIPDFSKPQFFPERLKEFESKNPKSIFVNSMSDVSFWDESWVNYVWQVIYENPQHKYIFLTKGEKKIIGLKSVYSGKTITRQKDIDKKLFYHDFLNIEPVLEPIDISAVVSKFLKQIIIGAETGNRKSKVIPQKQWIDDIVKQADEYKIRIFMKESLRRLMGADFRQDKLIWEV